MAAYLDEGLRQDILGHARQKAAMSPPEEAVGVIRNGAYIPLENKAADKTKAFAIDSAVIKDKNIEGIVHSHPGGPAWPSCHDMKSQMDSGLVWHIAVVGTALTPEVKDEVFSFGMPPQLSGDEGYRHGVSDCYSLIRGYYAKRWGICLDDVPREWAWWQEGEDLYEKCFRDVGFERVQDEAPKEGDVFLARVRSPVVNHAGIWLGDGLIFHHIGGREGINLEKLPQKEPAERWMKFIDGWIRHKDLNELTT